MRAIDDEGEQLGVLSLTDALALAAEKGLDLVEVSPNAVPPVCRIMDYGKFKYEQSKKAAEVKKKTTRVEIKEVKMRPKTEEHDFLTKVKHARRFLEEGNKVKVTIMFRGREQSHPELGIRQIDKFVEAVKDIAQVEASPSRMGRFLHMVVAPIKK